MNPVQQLQRQVEILHAVDLIAGIALLGLFIWSIVWTVKAFNRWERRDEAKLQALQRIAAKLNAEPHAKDTGLPDFRATR